MPKTLLVTLFPDTMYTLTYIRRESLCREDALKLIPDIIPVPNQLILKPTLHYITLTLTAETNPYPNPDPNYCYLSSNF